jgi:hypothetical protein
MSVLTIETIDGSVKQTRRTICFEKHMATKPKDVAMGALGIGAFALCVCSWLFYDGKHGLEMFDTSSPAIVESDTTPSPSDKPRVIRPEVIVFMSNNKQSQCWQRCEAPLFQAAGWQLAYCYEHEFTDTPTFIVTGTDGNSCQYAGYLCFSAVGNPK